MHGSGTWAIQCATSRLRMERAEPAVEENHDRVGSPDTEFLRKYLMIRWPTGAKPGGYPGYIP